MGTISDDDDPLPTDSGVSASASAELTEGDSSGFIRGDVGSGSHLLVASMCWCSTGVHQCVKLRDVVVQYNTFAGGFLGEAASALRAAMLISR